METMYVWIFLFAGATIALLAILLLTSERQLRKKRCELEAIARAQSESSSRRESEAEFAAQRQELMGKIALLSSKLEESERTVNELQAEQRGRANADFDKQQQERTITELRAQLQASEKQLTGSAGQARENAERALQLETNLVEMARQRQANDATIAELQAGQEQILEEARAEKQRLCAENQQLQREIAELKNQAQTSETLLGTKSTQYAELTERHGQLQSELAELKQQLDQLTTKDNALSEEKDALSSKLADRQKTIEELRLLQEATQSESQCLQTANQELQRELAKLNLDLQSIQSRFGEAERHAQDSVDRNSKLEREAGDLREQLRSSQNAIEQFHTDQQRWSAIDLENQNLRHECADLRDRLQSSDGRLSELSRLNQESADHCARLKGEAADLARRLEETEAQIRELDRLKQELASVESRDMALRRRQDEQETQIASLQRQLFEADGAIQALAAARSRLAETERLYHESLSENQRLEQEISQRESRDSRQEKPTELDTHPEPLGESQQPRAQLRELNDEELRLSPSDADIKHFLQSTMDAGGESGENEQAALNPPRPVPADTASLSANSSTAGSGDGGDLRLPVYPDDDDFRTATVVKQIPKMKKSRTAAISAIVVLAIAAGGTAGILGTRYFVSTDATVTREFMPDERSTPNEALSTAAEPKPGLRLQGKFKIVRATEVYSGPTEKSALITRIEPGIKINVVDSRNGWLEIRSKHGRPPGFVREETAVKIEQN